MQLLLRQDVENLGKRGEVVNVTNGYGRNYLLPCRIAVAVSSANVRELEAERKRLDAFEAERRATLVDAAAAVSKVSVTLQVKANEEGHLFGSVGATEIAAALNEEDLKVQPDMIVLEKPIKQLGVFEVDVRLDPEVSAPVKVWVVGE